MYILIMCFDLFQIRNIERRTRFYGSNPSPASGTQKYNAWIVKEQQQAESVGEQDSRNVIDSCEALNVSLLYHVAKWCWAQLNGTMVMMEDPSSLISLSLCTSSKCAGGVFIYMQVMGTQVTTNSFSYFYFIADVFLTWERFHWFTLLKNQFCSCSCLSRLCFFKIVTLHSFDSSLQRAPLF